MKSDESPEQKRMKGVLREALTQNEEHYHTAACSGSAKRLTCGKLTLYEMSREIEGLEQQLAEARRQLGKTVGNDSLLIQSLNDESNDAFHELSKTASELKQENVRLTAQLASANELLNTLRNVIATDTSVRRSLEAQLAEAQRQMEEEKSLNTAIIETHDERLQSKLDRAERLLNRWQQAWIMDTEDCDDVMDCTADYFRVREKDHNI